MTKADGGRRLLLAMDTSTTNMSIALLDGDKLLDEHNSVAERNHSIQLLPAIEELLAKTGIDKRELTGIAVGLGPGSYTGVRIGVTVGKMTAWALQIPIVGVSTLEALALSSAMSDEEGFVDGWITPVLDARRSQAYTALYALEQGRTRKLEEDGIRLADGWLNGLSDRIQAGEVNRWRIAGEIDAFRAMIDELTERGATVEAMQAEVRAYAVGILGRERLDEGLSADAHLLTPNYTQLAEAEAKLLAKRK